jgi:MoaA/NifB/PqqE/SkfB family radical SAM enzyme
MKNSLTYITRRCPRNCAYCGLRDAIGVGKELTKEQWAEAFQILETMGVDFNLILGNETWLLHEELPYIMQRNKVPYAIYTTSPGTLFPDNREKLLVQGVLDNFSSGVDFPSSRCDGDDDMYRKSKDSWESFRWIKKNTPWVDCQATITIHRKNIKFVPEIIREATEMGIPTGINFIHYNKDGGFDFFGTAGDLKDYVFQEEDRDDFLEVMSTIKANLGMLQSTPQLELTFDEVVSMGWHCKGNPYGGPTIDADGTLRVCGYRKGTRTPKYTIFDLPEKENEWREAVRMDAMECPGCSWSYPYMTHYWECRDDDFGKKVFNDHAGLHIAKEQWAERRIKISNQIKNQ